MNRNKVSAIDDSLVMVNGLYIYSHCLINVSEDTPHIFTIVSNDNLEIYDQTKVFGFIYDKLMNENILYACSHYFDTYNDFHMITKYEISKNLIRQRNNYERNVINLFRKVDVIVRDSARLEVKNIERRLAW